MSPIPYRVVKLLVFLGLACLLVVLWAQRVPAGGSEPRVGPSSIEVVSVNTPNGEILCVTYRDNGIDCDWGEE